ncbi:hypothetical protein NE237_024372 [Protea cynaroides]|uniref:NAC domain-containing protein n=1 Tax=Protea cynaroides TaxID=273540 RepID=A0A9Q0HGQ8_9MAGN|nr:hypothetical protein NE237_024372 [Protea cynaroides]
MTMCPPAPVPTLGPIEFHSPDGELVGHLERMVRGASLPSNVISDVNPYNVLPWNLPDHIWCFFNSEDPKDTENGYWKITGVGHKIPTNATTTGCRTTLEFYQGRAPNEIKTDWMMYEYKLYRKGLFEKNEILDSSSLCRVFLNSIQSPNREEHQNHTAENFLHAEDGSNRSQVNYGLDEIGWRVVSERYLPDQRPDNPVEDLHECYDGDFLELLDLVNHQSPSSSSENSSCLTMSSDEYFDSLALLRDIEAGKSENENTQKNQTNSNFCVSTSHRPKQMVLKPTSSGSAVERHVLERKMQNHVAVQVLSTNSANKVASSSGLPADSDGKRKTVGRMTKFWKKYLCCFPF